MDSPTASPAGPGELLERARELATLAERLAAVRQDGAGHLVLVAGEAGVGKTALLRTFCAAASDDSRVLWSACDSLFTPQPLGPLLDIAETTGGELAELVAGGAKPHAIGTALLHELTQSGPSVLVIEDLHWA